MDGNGNLFWKNWGSIEAPANTLKNSLGLQLMSSVSEKPLFGGGHLRDHPQTNPLLASTNGGPFHHHRVGGISESHIMDSWLNPNRILFGNQHHAYYQSSNYGVSLETSPALSVQMPQQQMILPKNENPVSEMEDVCEERDSGSGSAVVKKRVGCKNPNSMPKEKKPRTKTPRPPKDETDLTVYRARTPKKRAEVVINGVNMDISEIPIPVCSCTGTPQQCYRWGSGGWQSACCTTGLSMYPLPMSTKRRGARIAGRKMSIGAFKKVLEKLASEGYNFSSPIDLRVYWAKHGTNKFVTIR